MQLPLGIPPAWIAYGLLALGVGGYVLHAEHTKRNYAIAQAYAKAQEKTNAIQALRDMKAKERSDENYQRRVTRLTVDLKRLRNARTSLVPAPSPSAPDPSRACFDRGQLDAALRAYREGVIGLVGEGAAAVDGLDEAKVWAQGR